MALRIEDGARGLLASDLTGVRLDEVFVQAVAEMLHMKFPRKRPGGLEFGWRRPAPLEMVSEVTGRLPKRRNQNTPGRLANIWQAYTDAGGGPEGHKAVAATQGVTLQHAYNLVKVARAEHDPPGTTTTTPEQARTTTTKRASTQ